MRIIQINLQIQEIKRVHTKKNNVIKLRVKTKLAHFYYRLYGKEFQRVGAATERESEHHKPAWV